MPGENFGRTFTNPLTGETYSVDPTRRNKSIWDYREEASKQAALTNARASMAALEADKARTEEAFGTIEYPVNRMRDIYEISRDLKLDMSTGESADKSREAIKNWMLNGNYAQRLDKFEQSEYERLRSEGLSEDMASSAAEHNATVAFQEDLDAYTRNWNPDIAYTDKMVFDPATLNYVERTAETEDYPSTSGELLQGFANYYGIGNSSYLESLVGDSRGTKEEYPSQTGSLLGSLSAGLVLPRTYQSYIDDEYKTRTGNSMLKNVAGDLVENAVAFVPWGGVAKGTRVAKTLSRLGEMANSSRLGRIVNSPILSNRGTRLLSNVVKTAVYEGARNVASDAAGALYDQYVGTNRGYEFDPSRSFAYGAVGGAMGGFVGGSSPEVRTRNSLWTWLHENPDTGKKILEQEGWKSAADIPDEWIARYAGKTDGGLFRSPQLVDQSTFANQPLKGFEDQKFVYDTRLNLSPIDIDRTGYQRYLKDRQSQTLDIPSLQQQVREADRARRTATREADERLARSEEALAREQARQQTERMAETERVQSQMNPLDTEAGDPTAIPRTTNERRYDFWQNPEDGTWWRIDRQTSQMVLVPDENLVKNVRPGGNNDFADNRVKEGAEGRAKVTKPISDAKPYETMDDYVSSVLQKDVAEKRAASEATRLAGDERFNQIRSDLLRAVSASKSKFKPDLSNFDDVTEDMWRNYANRTHKIYKYPTAEAMLGDEEMKQQIFEALRGDLARMKAQYNPAGEVTEKVDYDIFRSGKEIPGGTYNSKLNALRSKANRSEVNKAKEISAKDAGNMLRMSYGRTLPYGDVDAFNAANREAAIRHRYGSKLPYKKEVEDKLYERIPFGLRVAKKVIQDAGGALIPVAPKLGSRYDIPSLVKSRKEREIYGDKDEAFTDEEREERKSRINH